MREGGSVLELERGCNRRARMRCEGGKVESKLQASKLLENLRHASRIFKDSQLLDFLKRCDERRGCKRGAMPT